MYFPGDTWICNGQNFLVSRIILQVSPVICLVLWEVRVVYDARILVFEPMWDGGYRRGGLCAHTLMRQSPRIPPLHGQCGQ